MRFDPISFVIGFAAASFFAFLLWRSRRQIAKVQQQVEEQVGTTRKFLSNTAEGRYYGRMVSLLNGYHLAGDTIPLSEIYVEPRFLPPPEVHDPTDEKAPTVFHVVPIIPELPAAYAPYNLESLSINELRSGERHLAILGLPGAGKSTALAVLGLIASGEIEIPVIDLTSDEVFREEIKNLPPDEQQKKLRQLKDIQERAMDQIRRSQRGDEEVTTSAVIDFTTLLPILVDLREIDLRPATYGAENGKKALDPAEPLVLALQRKFGGIAASVVPKMVYERLTAGRALVLIDGYDDLPAADRAEKLTWLRSFLDVYRANFIVIAGPVNGYDALVNLGFSPILLRAWTDADYEQLVRRWTAVWPSVGEKGKRGRASLPDEKLIKRVSTANRGRLPMDVTLKIWAAFSDDEQEQGRRGWYDFYVRRSMTNPELRSALGKVAVAMLDNGGTPLTRDGLKAALTGFGGYDGKSDELITRLVGASSLLTEWAGEAFGFRNALVHAYLAAETLDDGTAAIAASKPAWANAMPFAAIRLPLEAPITERLNAPPDLLFNNLFSLAHWTIDAPTTVAWRGEFFKRVASALIGPSQFPIVREWAMAALVTSRDKGVLFILKQAMKHANAHVRRLGAVGLGAIGDAEVIKDITPLLQDANPDVQLAAGLALGVIGTDAALDTMVGGLIDGEQNLRRAVAEALAAIPGVGHATLREAIASEDMMVRHAAVFGLARVRAAWALTTLYRTLLEDEQWYVRNAAEQAFKEVERPDRGGVRRAPEPDKLRWLVSWAAERGEGVPAGPNSRLTLIRVLQEGDPMRRATAARTLANMGYIPALKPLYGALRDRDEDVRAAVYEALSTLQTRLGQPLPSV